MFGNRILSLHRMKEGEGGEHIDPDSYKKFYQFSRLEQLTSVATPRP